MKMVTSGLVMIAVLLLAVQAEGGHRTDVPLRNWDGFAINRHWTYDAIEKLVLAGLADRVVFNTKPLSRIEMARIVAQVVKKIRDHDGFYHDRRDLEDVLDRLIDEFRPELARLGVEPYATTGKPHEFWDLKPLDKLQTRAVFADTEVSLENNQGDVVGEDFSARMAFFSRAQVGDFLSVVAEPEFRVQKGPERFRLLEGYVKLSGLGMEIGVGRESLWWGPGFHGSLLFSNNAQPLNVVRFSTEAFIPPWIFRYVGPTKLSFGIAELDENRDFPKAKILAFRINSSPLPFLELGVSPAIQYNGEGQPSVEFYQIPELIWEARSSSATVEGSEFGNVNALFSLDATVRLPNINRYVPIGRDLELYGEMGVDDIDTRFFLFVIPRKPAFLVGVYVQNFLQWPNTDVRFEYAQTSSISFNHAAYTTGFSFKDQPLSHFIGTDGQDIYLRVTRRLSADVMAGFEVGYSQIGSTHIQALSGPRQKRLFSGVDLSYRVLENLSLFGRFRLHRYQDLDFLPGNDKTVPLIVLEGTYSF
ncbi:MAG: hypothetical protein HY347_10555 [candidate division NC10 bacterium]|nr:hypothetical protein [candidate division NC10 bacterium]